MAKFLSHVFLFAATLLVGLGNFWFTYGIWPKSWWSFGIFGVLGTVIIAMRIVLQNED